MAERKLSEAEQEALSLLKQRGGSMLVSEIPEKNERHPVFRTITPGMSVYQKLEKKGLVLITEEDPIMDVPEDDPLYGFTFTPMVELTRGN